MSAAIFSQVSVTLGWPAKEPDSGVREPRFAAPSEPSLWDPAPETRADEPEADSCPDSLAATPAPEVPNVVLEGSTSPVSSQPLEGSGGSDTQTRNADVCRESLEYRSTELPAGDAATWVQGEVGEPTWIDFVSRRTSTPPSDIHVVDGSCSLRQAATVAGGETVRLEAYIGQLIVVDTAGWDVIGYFPADAPGERADLD